ncbi:sec-independent protein translocase protein TatA [Paenibacillus sp. yr247]|nr:sec-independent protein translocase protein TatA [Paenibacillus sp. yr247]
MFQNIGFTELILIAIVALVLFGPQKLPEIGRVLGRTIRDFKKGAHALLNDEPQAPAESKPAAPVTPSAEQSVPPMDVSQVSSAEPAVPVPTPALPTPAPPTAAPPAAAPIAPPSNTRRLPD